MRKPTAKEEKFAIEFVRTGNKSEAYRSAYSASKMKAETIHKRASELSSKGVVKGRIEELQNEIIERNKIDVDELVGILAKIARFDIAELYDEKDSLKSIHEIHPDHRTAIDELHVSEEFETIGRKKVFKGYLKKVKASGKINAIDKLLRHLGGYEKDNEQKQPSSIDTSKLSIEDLIALKNIYAKAKG